MFREGPLHLATSLCHRTPSKPHSTIMINFVVLTRTCLNMLHWEFLNLNIVYNGCKTYHVRGKACFSMVFNGFQWFSAWWHCSSTWVASVPWTSEDAPGVTDVHNIVVLTVYRQFWIGVVCNTLDMNQWQRKPVVLMVINGSPWPSSNVFQAAKMDGS